MNEGFDTRQLPGEPDALAPDGSDVRVLLQLSRGSMAHFELGAGRVSRPVAHRSVDEIGLTDAARTRTSTSSSSAAGTSMSRSSRTSGGPYLS